MQAAIITSPSLKEELINNGMEDARIFWLDNLEQLASCPTAEVVMNLMFDQSHLASLSALKDAVVIINSVDLTLAETNESFVRINGWPGFLQSSLIEGSCLQDENRQIASELFSVFHKKIEWLPDTVGFVTPRVISMIINEAFIALHEGVSTTQEINTAMKLGTNYPYGPFDWAEKIGLDRVKALLQKLEAHAPQLQ